MALLSVEELRAQFGGIVALADLSFTVDLGEICALIGPNGAGKTTLFNCVEPRLSRARGRGGSCSTGRTAARASARQREERASHTYVPENLALFPALTVLDNGHGRRATRAGGGEAARAEGREIPEAALVGSIWPTTPGQWTALRHAQAVSEMRALAARPKLLLLMTDTEGPA